MFRELHCFFFFLFLIWFDFGAFESYFFIEMLHLFMSFRDGFWLLYAFIRNVSSSSSSSSLENSITFFSMVLFFRKLTVFSSSILIFYVFMFDFDVEEISWVCRIQWWRSIKCIWILFYLSFFEAILPVLITR